MKISKNVIIACASIFLLSSCNEFLDVQPEGNYTSTSYFNNDQQSVDAVNGLYHIFQLSDPLFGRGLFWEQGAACDIVWGRTRSFNTLATFKYSGDEGPLRSAFEETYKNLSYSNWVVSSLLKKESKTALTAIERRSLGEAYFMRGMLHFIVAYRYGTDKQGVPFVRYEDYDGVYDNSIPKQQPTVMDNFKFIIEDMDNAIKYLPDFSDYAEADKGRAHQAAAVAYKAKVYAYWATWDNTKWNDVISMVNNLENTYGRSLASSLDIVFSSDFKDFWNSEYIWSIPTNGGASGAGTQFPGVVLENKAWGVYNGWGQIKPTNDIYQEMLKDGEGNSRLRRSILEYNQEFLFWGEKKKFSSSSDLEAGFQINKYMDAFKYYDAVKLGYVNSNGDYPTARINFPLIRFAEMLLFRAEAYIMTAQPEKAKLDINAIRKRSNLELLKKNPTMADLYHERRCELAFEFTDHLYDLKRWYISSDATIKAIAAKELNSRPTVRKYVDRSNPESTFIIGEYEDYKDKASYDEHLMVFPYPSDQITKSNGLLKQNPGY